MSENLYEGYGWQLRMETAQLPDGREKNSIRAKLPDTAHILAFPEPGIVLLLREFRPFYGRYLWMIPSGKLDKEKKDTTGLDETTYELTQEEIRAGAMRELREETGYAAGQLLEYGTFRNIESVNYTCHLFLARALTHDPLPQDATELIEVHALPLDEAIKRVLSDPPAHTMTAMALLKCKADGEHVH